MKQLFFMLLVCAMWQSTSAQTITATLPSSESRNAARLLLPSGATSDAAAQSVINRIVNPGSTGDGWRSIKSITVRYGTADATDKPHELLMLDDWNDDKARYRRGVPGSGISPRDHDGQATFTVSMRSGKRTVPEFDQATLLADHLPGAAAEIIQRKPEYVVKTVPDQECPSADTCLDIYLASKTGAAFLSQRWWVVRSSGQVEKIAMRQPDLAGTGRLFWKIVDFSEYSAKFGPSVPTLLRMYVQGSATPIRTLRLVNLITNSGYDKAAFDGELVK